MVGVREQYGHHRCLGVVGLAMAPGVEIPHPSQHPDGLKGPLCLGITPLGTKGWGAGEGKLTACVSVDPSS